MLVMDGAMGTLIAGPAKDTLNLTAPEIVRTIHRRYLEAGADILKTNTFNSNSGAADYVCNVAGARLARELADEFTAVAPSKPRWVAGAMGPGAGEPDFYTQACGLADGGVDLFLVETITSIATARAALTAIEKWSAKTGRTLPAMMSATISKSGSLISGESLEQFWQSLADAKLFAVGINCSFGARHVGPYIERLAAMASTKVSCHPSAGLPSPAGGYDETPEEFARFILEFAAAGWVDIGGGCCGTTPAHIRAIAGAVRGIPRVTIDDL
jgi:5-methyltetrahydrofolate--homocysteine methyltransferase